MLLGHRQLKWNLGEEVKAWLRQQRVYGIVLWLWNPLPKRVKGYLDVEQDSSSYFSLFGNKSHKKRPKKYKWS